MAYRLEYDAQTALVAGRYSESFFPRTSFCVFLDGTPAQTTYKVQTRPIGGQTWIDANGTNIDFGGTSLKRMALVTHFDGFEYRIDRGGNTAEASNTDIAFYIGQSVILDVFYAKPSQIGG